jgi:uncharacterized protein (TIGR00255 family)
MLLSMTGFGRAEVRFPTKSISIEIKSLNSKQSDIYLRLPNVYKAKEIELRNLVLNHLERGKIDVTIFEESTPGITSHSINIDVVNAYFDQLKPLYKTNELNSDILNAILRLPDVAVYNKAELDENEWQKIIEAFIIALKDVNKFRADEGGKLKEDLEVHLKKIQNNLIRIIQLDEIRIQKLKNKLHQAVTEIKEELLDKNRFEQELIYYLEKLDINEEKVRLSTHCNYFIEILNSKETSKGKKLGFISQEIGREINTIGSKANDYEIQKLVVEMKDELEKIKEQMLNCL